MTNQPLSKLQKHILTLAEQKEYVHYTDVLQSWYGFIPNRITIRANQSAFTNHDHVRRKIRAARVGICKSFNRLAARGLVRRVHEPHHWSTVTLNKAERIIHTVRGGRSMGNYLAPKGGVSIMT